MEWGRTRLAQSARVLIAASIMLAASTTAAQETAPPAPAPTIPPPVIVPLPQPSAASSSDSVAERLRKLEETNQKLMDRLERLSQENQKLSREVKDLSGKVTSDEGDQGGNGAATKDEKKKDSGIAGQGGLIEAEQRRSAKLEELTGGERSSGFRLLPYAQGIGNRYLDKIPIKGYLDYGRDGVGLSTDDDEFQLKFRIESQTQYLGYLGPTEYPTTSGFYMPRNRFYFQGRYTKPINYQMSFQQGYGSFDVLNAFLNFDYFDKKLQFRFGRYKAPYTYEWYKLNNWRMITPERSLFAENFGLNRMVGGMLWGELNNGTIEYAAALMDGPRGSFQDYNTGKDVIAFLNFRPFQSWGGSFLQNLNIGGSMDYGRQDNPARPAVLRTNTNGSNSSETSGSTTANAALPFLAFNNNVVERGNRQLWELHAAYYYGGFSLYSGWGSGFNSFAAGNQRPVALPVNGWHVSLAYLLTGETLYERTVVDPIHRFDLRPGKFGLGAWEPFFRYSELNVGKQVFTAGLADPNLWSNRASLTDVGVNWYLNRAIRIVFDWEHAMFGSPVYYAPGHFASTNDLLWVRFQVYY